jgi:hypothetical protein
MTKDEALRLALEALIEVRDANIHGLTLTQDYHKAIKAAVLAEREACAKVCEAMNWYMDDGEECATAIRSRGQA